MDDIQKDKNAAIEFDVSATVGFQVGLNIQDNAGNADNCDAPYRMSIVDPGTGIGEMMSSAVSPGKVLTDTVAQLKRSQGIWTVSFAGAALMMLELFVRIYGKLADAALSVIGQANGTLATIAGSTLAFNILNFVTFGALAKHRRILDYSNNSTFPVGVPSPSEAGSAWLGNTIDDCTFQAYVEAGDNRFEPFRRVVSASKFKFSALELMTLNRRHKLERSDIKTRLRELGALEPEDTRELNSLFEQLPGPADLIRFMVRDVANKDIVDSFRLDTGFTDNFQGDIKEWADQQGLSDKVMLNEWRAHWSIPSPTQLYEMLHKLRDNPRFGGTAKVTEDIRKALQQQDILPFWIDRLMEVSYHPLTRTDLFRAYERGWIDDDAFLLGMHKNGYNDDDAKTLLRFSVNERKIVIRNSDWGRLYVTGHLSMEQAKQQAQAEGFDPSIMGDLDNILTPMKDHAKQAKVLDAMIRQYKACRMSLKELRQEAEQHGIPDEIVDYQLEWAGENSTCGTRREWQSNLCSALAAGDITADDYVKRMKELKYDEYSTNLLLGLCKQKISAAQKRELDRAAKEQEREARREQSAEEKAERKAQQQANKLARGMQAMERSRQSRNKLLERAAFTLDRSLADADGTAATLVAGLYSSLQSVHGLSQNEAASLLNSQSSLVKGITTAEFVDAVNDAARLSLEQPWTLFPGFSTGQ